jgi:integrase
MVLRRALADAVDWGLLDRNPAEKAKAPRGRRQPVVILTPSEAQHFLDKAQGSRWYVLWALMLHTGLRPGEVIALRWQDIHWDTHTLQVVQAVSGDGSRRVVGPTKTERSTRPVALGPHMMELLAARRQEQTMDRAAAGDRWEDDHDLIFTTYRGKLLSPNNVARSFHRVREQAGLPATIHPHCLRHTMASHWLAAGQSIKVVSERLGHTSVAFTLQTYAHLLPNQQADAAAAMDTRLFLRAPHPHDIPTSVENQ